MSFRNSCLLVIKCKYVLGCANFQQIEDIQQERRERGRKGGREREKEEENRWKPLCTVCQGLAASLNMWEGKMTSHTLIRPAPGPLWASLPVPHSLNTGTSLLFYTPSHPLGQFCSSSLSYCQELCLSSLLPHVVLDENCPK